jgi:lysophospholipase L1-like esterase
MLAESVVDQRNAGVDAPVPYVLGIAKEDGLHAVLVRNQLRLVGRFHLGRVRVASQFLVLVRYRAMIDRAKLNGGRVILLPVVPRSDATADGRANLVALNNALRDLAPQDWADWVAFLKSDAAFTAAGISKTSDDAADIVAGDTPRSFRSDTLHLNAAGYTAANQFITLVNVSRGL